MTTINAQTIINAVMAAHAVAPTKSDSQYLDNIKFQTSARGFQTVHNCRENLQRFADLVKKNARIFGGGLIKEEKPRQASVYQSKTVSLLKQLIEDQDYSAALALADEKLSPMFFMGSKGVAAMLVAPEVFEHDARLITGMTERGTWSVTEPVSMQSLNGFSVINKRSRNSQIDHVMARYNGITEEKRTLAIETARQKPDDQAASRAAWIAQHGLTEEATTAARIESEEMAREEEKTLGQRFDEERAKRKAAREAAAVQDVAQVVAQAVAAVAIGEAMATTEQDTTQELATCEAGDAQAQSPTIGNAGTWAPVPQYIPTSVAHINAGQPTQPAFRGGGEASGPGESTPENSDTLEAFEAGDGVSFELCDAINRATVAQVQGLTDAQFSKLYDHLENWNFHSENYLIEALRTGDACIVADMRQVMADQTAAGYLRGDIYDRRNAIAQRIRDAQKAQANANQQAKAAAAEASQAASNQTTAPKAYKFKPGAQVQIIRSKSQKWLAEFRAADCGLFELGFKRPWHHPARSTTYATTRERMAALQAMARAADAPTDTPTPPAPPAPDFEPAGDLGQPTAPEQTPAVPQSETPRDLETNQAEAVGADFERVEPIRVDLAALIIKGVKPEELVGMGIYCSGDRANPSGSGAITGFSHSDFYGLVVDVTLEDGRVWRAIRTSSFKDGWFSLNAKMHGAPYLAELAMGATLAKSKDTSAKELAKQAHAQALIDLAAQFPQLKRAESTYAGGKLAAVNMRVFLKAAFKGVKFSVTSTYSSARIVWTDGPTDAQVQEVIGRFDIGVSDTQSDYFYTVATAFSQLFGGVQYLTTRREETDALIQEAIDKAFINSMEKPALADWKTGKNEMSWGDWKRRRVQEALNTISKA